MGQGFDPKCKSLIPVHTRVIGTHVFVCLGDEPPEDILYLDQVMTQRFAQYDIAHSKIAHESEIIENGNWKLVIENNRECYHCAATQDRKSTRLNSSH